MEARLESFSPGIRRNAAASCEQKQSKIDEPEVIRMMRYAFDHGVNYIDSAYGYHHGNSEIVIGKALEDGYREKVRIATKIPSHEVHAAQDFDRSLNEELKRLQTDRIDLYLLHQILIKRHGRKFATLVL